MKEEKGESGGPTGNGPHLEEGTFRGTTCSLCEFWCQHEQQGQVTHAYVYIVDIHKPNSSILQITRSYLNSLFFLCFTAD